MEYLNKKLISSALKTEGCYKLVSILGFFLYIDTTFYLSKGILLSNMSLDELISIERVEFETSKERIQETYVVNTLPLSKLFMEVLLEINQDILPILNIKILLYALRSIHLTDEVEGLELLKSLNDCIENQLYGKSNEWDCKAISTRIKELRQLVLYDYIIEGSLKLYHDNQILWDIGVSINFTLFNLVRFW